MMKTQLLVLLLCIAVCTYNTVVLCQYDSEYEAGERYIAKFQEAFRKSNVSETAVLKENVQDSIGVSFNCPTSKPSYYKEPTSIHVITPWDVDIMAGMGDSVTAGMGAGASTLANDFIEFRGLSWSIGGDSELDQVITLPNIIKKYNPNVKGFATGWAWLASKKLSVARSGAVAENMLGQAEVLVQKMDEMYSSREEVDSKWKVITIWIGANDLCAICDGMPEDHTEVYIERIASALDYLQTNVKRAYVNLVLMIDVTELAKVRGLICSLVHVYVCDCATKNSTIDLISKTSRLYNENLQLLMSLKDNYNKDNFTVVVQPFFSGTGIPKTSAGLPDKSYFAPDCFHLSKKGHGVGALYLWNNMLEPFDAKTYYVDWDDLDDFRCPSYGSPYFFTTLNSEISVLNANSADNGIHRQHSFTNLLLTLVGTGVCVFLIAVVVAIVTVSVVHLRKRSSNISLEALRPTSVKLYKSFCDF